MTGSVPLGVFLHAVGGCAAGSFYAPLKRVNDWAWESSWLVMGLAAWLCAPWIVALITTAELGSVLRVALKQSWGAVVAAVVFGVLWGVGNLTFGLSIRYLGMALGYSVALGACMVFGTWIPPLFEGRLFELLRTTSGQTVFAGTALVVLGIVFCGMAGRCREVELADSGSPVLLRVTATTGVWLKGMAVAMVAGVLSACFAFALAAGKPIAEIAVQHGTPRLYSNNSVLAVILLGGLMSNAAWCLALQWQNGTFRDFSSPKIGNLANWACCVLSGVTWYGQFFFYGMGTTKLGEQYDFSSWSIHMAFIILFSNLWGIVFREWQGTRFTTQAMVWTGIFLLLFSTVVIGYGNSLVTA